MGKWHNHKSIDKVIDQLVRVGWTLNKQGHMWNLLCPCGAGRIRVDGTPRNPEMAARIIARQAKRCPDRHELDGRPRT
ncbi:hypothetical protein FDZ84_10230 [Saccharopolyspora sp. ASAGF58]|nr:hypothetical protein FDZ84_10230 [Saccharopolyspora sp. ASAGF58]